MSDISVSFVLDYADGHESPRYWADPVFALWIDGEVAPPTLYRWDSLAEIAPGGWLYGEESTEKAVIVRYVPDLGVELPDSADEDVRKRTTPPVDTEVER